MSHNPLPFNDKCKESIKDTGFLTVWEGAVRSSKTVVSLFAWLFYVMESKETVFLMSGNTMGSISRNCIDGDFGFITITAGLAEKRQDTDGSKYLSFIGNKIYYCGADNKASFKKIRGLTLGGWYADEINLHDKQFIAEAMRRTIASRARKHFWTLNPEAPGHWVYKEYIDKYLNDKIKGYRWFHFGLDDNPSLTEERKDELEKEFTGLFYQRYILGRRVKAEGSCYPSFDRNCIITDFDMKRIRYVNIGVDIGGSGSATAFITTGVYIDKSGKFGVIILDEYYFDHNKQKDAGTEKIIQDFKDYVAAMKELYRLEYTYVDSAEQLIKKSMSNLGIVKTRNSAKKPIVDRIRFTDRMMALGRFKIMGHCKHFIEAIEGAVWDEKSIKAVRLDDGTSNIDSLDAYEYSIERDIRNFI